MFYIQYCISISECVSACDQCWTWSFKIFPKGKLWTCSRFFCNKTLRDKSETKRQHTHQKLKKEINVGIPRILEHKFCDVTRVGMISNFPPFFVGSKMPHFVYWTWRKTFKNPSISRDVKTHSFTVIWFFHYFFFSPKPYKPEVPKLLYLYTFVIIYIRIIAFKFS